MSFQDLKIIDPILRALSAEGYVNPTPIQEQAIPELLAGRDLLGCAQTGTGKTAAFSIPILQDLFRTKDRTRKKRAVRALVLTPTRELAAQIADSFTSYGRFLGLKNTVIFGGVSQRPQAAALNFGVDVIIATPGRLLDLINQGIAVLDDVKYLVLDEADQMLDMGFITDVRKIIAKVSQNRQTMLFSATMPREIENLSREILKDPVKVAVTPISSPVEVIEQSLYYVERKNKVKLLIHLLNGETVKSALVFSRTKHGANKLCHDLELAGINAEAIHGNKSQQARLLALNKFKQKKIKVLVATDIAARGIDIDELSHVINYDLPEIPETYVHRIGRTGRAGNTGTAYSFCSAEERHMLKDIQKLISKNISVVEDHPFVGLPETAEQKFKAPSEGRPKGNFNPKPYRGNNQRRRKSRKQFN